MAIEVDYNGFTFTFPDGASDSEIYSFLEQNADQLASQYEPEEQLLDKPFYETQPEKKQDVVSEAFTNPTLDLSGQTVETQEGVTQYVEGYTTDGKIDPKSSRWKGMSSNAIIEARNQDVRDGVVGGHVIREGAAYDQNAQVAGVSRDQGIVDRQVELEQANPQLTKQELFDKANSDQKIDGAKNVAQAALMATPAGHGVWGMLGMGALAGAGDTALEVVADAAKGDRELLDSDNLVDIGEGALIGGALGGAAGALFKGAEKLIGALKKSPKVTEEISELAAKHGIELTPGQKVDSKLVKSIEGIVEDGVGGKSIANAKSDQLKKVEELAEKRRNDSRDSFVTTHVEQKDPDIQKAYKAVVEAESDDAIRAADASYEQLLQETTESALKAEKGYVSEMVNDEILKAAPEALASTRKKLGDVYNEAIKGLDAKYSEDVMTKHGEFVNIPTTNVDSVIKEVLSEEKRLGVLGNKTQRYLKGLADFHPENFQDLDLLKRNLNDKANSAYTKGDFGANKIFKKLSDAVKTDMDVVAKEVGGDTNLYKQADKDWSEFSKLSDSKMVKAIKNSEFGEDVWAGLRRGASKDSKVKKFTEVINQNPTAKKAMLVKFEDDAIHAARTEDGFSVRAYNKFLKDNLDALEHIDVPTHKRTEGLVKVLDIIGEGEQSLARAKSQGPLATIAAKLAPTVVGGSLGGMSGGWEGAAAGAIGGATARFGMANMGGLKALSAIASEKPFKLTEYLRSKKASKILIEISEANKDKVETLIDKLLKGFLVSED